MMRMGQWDGEIERQECEDGTRNVDRSGGRVGGRGTDLAHCIITSISQQPDKNQIQSSYLNNLSGA